MIYIPINTTNKLIHCENERIYIPRIKSPRKNSKKNLIAPYSTKYIPKSLNGFFNHLSIQTKNKNNKKFNNASNNCTGNKLIPFGAAIASVYIILNKPLYSMP